MTDEPLDPPRLDTDYHLPPLKGTCEGMVPEDLRSAEEIDREDDYLPAETTEYLDAGDGVAISEPIRSPITGGEGFGTVRRRHLLVLMPLPEYLKDKEHPERGIDYSLQGLMLEADIRDAMAKAARKLNDTAMKYSVTGYDWNLEDIVYDMPQPRTVSATLVIERE